jgi:DnaJ-class molecular chaperone
MVIDFDASAEGFTGATDDRDHSSQREEKSAGNTHGHRTWFEVLEVDSSASLVEIKAAYRKKIARYKVADLGGGVA